MNQTGKVKPSETVVIFGLGGLGFNALQMVLAMKVAKVIVVEQREQILAEAVNFGVPKEDVVPVGKDVVEFVQENKIVVDVVIDFVGVKDTFAASQQLGELRVHWHWAKQCPWQGVADMTTSEIRRQDRPSWTSRA